MQNWCLLLVVDLALLCNSQVSAQSSAASASRRSQPCTCFTVSVKPSCSSCYWPAQNRKIGSRSGSNTRICRIHTDVFVISRFFAESFSAAALHADHSVKSIVWLFPNSPEFFFFRARRLSSVGKWRQAGRRIKPTRQNRLTNTVGPGRTGSSAAEFCILTDCSCCRQLSCRCLKRAVAPPTTYDLSPSKETLQAPFCFPIAMTAPNSTRDSERLARLVGHLTDTRTRSGDNGGAVVGSAAAAGGASGTSFDTKRHQEYSMRDLFHFFINNEQYVDKLLIARQFVVDAHAKVRKREHESWSSFLYLPNFLFFPCASWHSGKGAYDESAEPRLVS